MTGATKRTLTIVLADDDVDDCLLTKEALAESHAVINLRFVHDGEQLMEYLHQRGRYATPDDATRPDLILLDLNMPRMNGREALEEIKSDARLRSIPVVILTTSSADEDIARSYNLGANSFVTKPVTFQSLVRTMQTLSNYWFDLVALPTGGGM